MEGRSGSIAAADKSGWELLLDFLVAVVWALFAAVQLKRIQSGQGWMALGMLVFNTLVAALFVGRRPAGRKGARWESGIAWIGTVLPMVGFRVAAEGLSFAGVIVQWSGLALMVTALISLGRSFGIAPADRGLVSGGLYRFVRHPLYLAEMVFYLGWLTANASWRNGAVLVLLLIIQIMRLLREEEIIEGYAAYSRKVRWRLVPFVW